MAEHQEYQELAATRDGKPIGPVPEDPGIAVPRVIWRHRWSIFAICLLSLGVGYYYVSQATPIYSSTSRLYVEREGPSIMPDFEWTTGGSGNYLYTQAELVKSAPVLNRAIEGGIHEQIIASSVQLVLSSAQFALRVVEGQILEGSIRRLVRAVTQGGQFTRQTIENEGLEGLLRRTVRAVLAAARRAQALHTGKLRYNLAWVFASLVLALLVALLVPLW